MINRLTHRLARYPYVLGLIYIFVIGGLCYTSLSHYAYDDPFITYRYARNLRDGLGYVYNPGERIQSTTTPLFTLLLALAGSVWPDLPRLAILIGAISLAAGGLLLWDIARSWKTPLAGWASLFLYPTFSLLLFTLGSETPLYLALCLAAIAFYLRRRYHLAAALSALAALTRPDGILLAAVLAADYIFLVRKPIPWRAALVYLGLTLPWLIFAWIYFGSPLPVTLAAKQHQGALAISQPFASGLLMILRTYTNQWYHGIQLALFLLGAAAWVRRPGRWGLLVIWSAAYFAAYSLLGVTRYFWYYAPLVPAMVAVTGLGVHAICKYLALRSRLAQPVIVVLLLTVSLAQANTLWGLRGFKDTRAAVYTAIGAWLQANTPAEASVASLEVGIIGYYAERTMIDFAGLLHPDVASRLTPGGTYDIAAQYAVEHYQPDYLVIRKGDFDDLRRSIGKNDACHVVEHFAAEQYDIAGNFNIYACP